MTDLIDTYLLNHGMPHEELCSIKRRKFYYYGIAVLGAVTLSFLGLAIFGVNPPL